MPLRKVSRSGATLPLHRYFRAAFAVTLIGLALGAALGWQATGTLGGALATLGIIVR